MRKIRLGRTELMVTKTAMGCLPVQRRNKEDAAKLLRAAYDGGINYFDTANAYSDSEEKIGLGLSDVRQDIILSTKSYARDKKGCMEHIDLSLKRMKTDYIDLFQFHQCDVLPDANDPNDAYAAALEAKKQGKIRHIGITTHRIEVAEQAIECGNFETLQFPFSYISTDRDLALAEKCKEADMGFIAMKGLAGGLLNNAKLCAAFMNEYDNVVPIWGVQTMEELNQWLALEEEVPRLDDEMRSVIATDKAQLGTTFCRGCGYCMPCPVGIQINFAARMNMLLRRSPWQQYYSPEWQAKMDKINDCIGCYQCASKCPYQLDTPNVLKYMRKDYQEFYEEHKHLL